jgi:hypothetical protein
MVEIFVVGASILVVVAILAILVLYYKRVRSRQREGLPGPFVNDDLGAVFFGFPRSLESRHPESWQVTNSDGQEDDEIR